MPRRRELAFEPMESRVVLSTSGALDPVAIDGLVEAQPEQILNHDPEITRLALTPEQVRENGVAVLRGQFTDLDRGDRHKVAIRWGDGTGQVLTLAQGQRQFAARHRYADDDPSGTPRDEFEVGVTVSDNAGGSDFDSVAGVIHNVAPEITAFRVTPRKLENGVVKLWGKFTDPGRPDVHTVFIDWGDGMKERTTLRPGSRAFAGRHVYQDDDPSGTPADRYKVRVVVADDDLGRDHAEGQTVIRNVRPEITSLAVRPLDVSSTAELAATEVSPAEVAPDVSPLPVIPTIDENGVVVLKGTFRDPGPLDTHTVVVHWGDGTADRWQLNDGQREFARRHQYLDDSRDNSTTNARDLYRIRVMVIDDDRGRDVEWTQVIVHNVAPEITSLAVRPVDITPADEVAPAVVSPDDVPVIPTIDENGVVALRGQFEDPGTRDAHTVMVDWGDGSVDRWNLRIGGREIFQTHQYLDDNPTDTPRDRYEIVVTVADDDGGRDTESVWLVVANVAPVITDFRAVTPDPGRVDPPSTVGIFGAFTDVGTLDTHMALVDWGDGTSSAVDVIEEGGSGRFLGRHTYRAPGVYEIVATLRDDDGGAVREAIRVVVPPLEPVGHQPQALSAALADWSMFD
jgi:hypothetical protein